MHKLWKTLRSTMAAIALHWRRLFRRAPHESRLGIAPRLSIAFGAVAILTVVANQITENGSTLIRAIEQAPVVAPRFEEQQSPEVLPAALDQFQRAVLARADSEAALRVSAYDEAIASLDVARGTYFETLTPTLDAATLLGLDGQVTAHGQLGADLVKSADSRRRLLNEFNIELAALDGRMKASLDRKKRSLVRNRNRIATSHS